MLQPGSYLAMASLVRTPGGWTAKASGRSGQGVWGRQRLVVRSIHDGAGQGREGAGILVHTLANTQSERRMSESSYAAQKRQDEPISI